MPRHIEGHIEDIHVQSILRTHVTFADGATKLAKLLLDWGRMAPNLVNPCFLEGRKAYNSPHPVDCFAPIAKHPYRVAG